MKNKVQIYVMTHKPFTGPDDPIYVPVHVGRRAWLTAHPGEESELLAYVMVQEIPESCDHHHGKEHYRVYDTFYCNEIQK